MTVTRTFNATGSWQSYTIPAGVTSIGIDAYGAGGGGSAGGNGGHAGGYLAVSPGQQIWMWVPGAITGQSSNSRGGDGGDGNQGNAGYGGGGSTIVRLTSSTGQTQVIAAGGGGMSGGGGAGGDGGPTGGQGSLGSDGGAQNSFVVRPQGGSGSSGGDGGVYSGGGSGGAGSAGRNWAEASPGGGGGTGGKYGTRGNGGGGGGAGWGGGGGGGAGSTGYGASTGGAGGSNYVRGTLSGTWNTPNGTTHGQAGRVELTHADPISAPVAPTGGTNTTTGDHQVLTWTRQVSTTRPYSSYQLRSRSFVGSSWGAWSGWFAYGNGSQSSYTTGPWPDNRAVQYQVRAVNDAGVSAALTLPVGYRTPANPSNVKASVSGTSVALTWTRTWYQLGSPRVYISRQLQGGGWVALTNIADATSFTDTSVPAGTVAYRVRVEIQGLASADVASPTVTVYAAPKAPTSVSVSRVSDTQQTVTWSNPAPGAGQTVANNIVQRRVPGGAWSTVATLAGSTTTFTDTSTAANSRYEYRIGARNSSTTTYSATASISTTPAAPTAVSAAKTPGGDIRVTATNNAPYAASFIVEDNPDGAGWVQVATPATLPWTHSSPQPDVTHQYRVFAVVTGPMLTSSASSPSNVVLLLGTPNAPTGLSPAGQATDAATGLDLAWQHNPVDTTAQSQYQLRHRLAGTSTWTVESPVASGDEHAHVDWPESNGQTLEWSVRTRGDYNAPVDADSWSPWSATAVVPLAATPVVDISVPENGGTYGLSVMTAVWAYYQEESAAQVAWAAELRDASGEVIETLSGAGAAESATFGARVQDNTIYTVRVRARSADGIWSEWAVSTVTVAYDPPPTPVITPDWDQATAAMTVIVDIAAPSESEVEPVTVTVLRQAGDRWELIALDVEAVPVGDAWTVAVVDPIPPLNVPTVYAAVVTSATPSSSQAVSEPVLTETYALWVSGGAGWSQSVALEHKPTVTVQPIREKVLRQFAGRNRPVEFAGQQRTQQITITGRIWSAWSGYPDDPAPSLEDEIRHVADLTAPLCVRRVSGQRHFVSSRSLTISGLDAIGFADMTWQLDEIDHQETTYG